MILLFETFSVQELIVALRRWGCLKNSKSSKFSKKGKKKAIKTVMMHLDPG